VLEWIRSVLALNVDLIEKGGYGAVFLLMAIESSFIPFPSEVVIPPAGFLAARGRMSPAWILLAGIGGSLAGAWVNYVLAVKVGRPFFHRWGKWFLVSERNLDRAEAFFARHGEIGTFVGRLVPGVRQLISIPAGMARMDLARFSFFTALGAGLWCTVLYGIGYSVGRAGEHLDLGRVKDRSWHLFLEWVLPAVALLLVAYVLWYRRRRRVRGAGASPGGGPGAESRP
jgi:membrane protein DedA with SNARE-associated domain